MKTDLGRITTETGDSFTEKTNEFGASFEVLASCMLSGSHFPLHCDMCWWRAPGQIGYYGEALLIGRMGNASGAASPSSLMSSRS